MGSLRDKISLWGGVLYLVAITWVLEVLLSMGFPQRPRRQLTRSDCPTREPAA